MEYINRPTGVAFELLFTGVVGVAIIHTLAPDHWMPPAILSRFRGWKGMRNALFTLVCGLCHVISSWILGILGLKMGVELLEWFGGKMESVGGILLIGFGLFYLLLGLRKVILSRLHGHSHSSFDHIHDEKMSVLSLLLIYLSDPCVPLIPIMFVSAQFGWSVVLILSLSFGIVTITSMIFLSTLALRGFSLIRFPIFEKYSLIFSGAIIAFVGIFVWILGI